MNKKLFAFVLIFIILLTTLASAGLLSDLLFWLFGIGDVNSRIDGDMVQTRISDNLDIQITPHTIQGLHGCQEITVTNLAGVDRNLDIALNFNPANNLKPTSLSVYDPTIKTRDLPYTCDGVLDFIDTDSASCDTRFTKEYDNKSVEQGGGLRTFKTKETYTVGWKRLDLEPTKTKLRNHNIYSFDNFDFAPDETKTFKVCLQTKPQLNLAPAKYDIFVKEHDTNFNDAVFNKQFVNVDPTLNSSCAYQTTFVIDPNGINYGNVAFKINYTTSGNNFDDRLYVYNNVSDSYQAWVNITSINDSDTGVIFTNNSVTDIVPFELTFIYACDSETPKYIYNQTMLGAYDFDGSTEITAFGDILVGGSWGINTTEAYSGTNSVVATGTDENLRHTDEENDDTTFVSYFYDVDATTCPAGRLMQFGLYDGSNTHTIGLTCSVSTTNYVTGLSDVDTGIARSIGWHKFEFYNNDSDLSSYIDGVLVNRTDTIATINRLSFDSSFNVGQQDGFDLYYAYADFRNTILISQSSEESNNEAPTIDTPTITPATAYTDDSLNCSTTIYDVDLDTLSANFSWYNSSTYYSSTVYGSLSNGTFVSDSLTPTGVQAELESWNCTIFANDGSVDSALDSVVRTISSQRPTITAVNITPTQAFTNTTLTGNYVVTDPNNATVQAYCTWFNGTTLDSICNDTVSVDVVNTCSLSTEIAKGETWNMSCNATDLTDGFSFNPNSSAITISDYWPSIPTLNSPDNNSVVATSVDLNCSNSTDIDGDTINYEFYGDTSNPPTTLLANSTNTNYTWSIPIANGYYWRCRANDGTEEGNYSETRFLSQITGAINVSVDCGSLTQAMYFDFVNESDRNDIFNATIDYNIVFDLGGGSGNSTAYGTLTDVNNISVCINTTVSSTYDVVQGELQYESAGYTARRYYLFEGARFSTTLFNDSFVFLPNGDATSFLFEFKSTDLSPYENKYASILRWYPELNFYDTVEMARTDNKGQTVMRVKVEDVDYRVALNHENGTIIKLFDAVRFICIDSPCSYVVTVEEEASDYSSIYGIEASLDFINDGVFYLTYNDPSQLTSTMNMSVYRDTGTSSVEICSTGASGFTGVLSCNVSQYSGTLRATVYRSASPSQVFLEKIVQTTTTIFQNRIGLFLGFLAFIVLVFFGHANPTLTIVFGILGLIPSVILGSISLTVFIGFGILGGLIIHFMKRAS